MSWKKFKRIFVACKSFCQPQGDMNKYNCFPISSAMLLDKCDEGMRSFQLERDPVVSLSHLYVL